MTNSLSRNSLCRSSPSGESGSSSRVSGSLESTVFTLPEEPEISAESSSVPVVNI
jgi:hypothetical protein